MSLMSSLSLMMGKTECEWVSKRVIKKVGRWVADASAEDSDALLIAEG